MDQLVLWANVIIFALMVGAAGLLYLVHLRVPRPWLPSLIGYTAAYATWLIFGTFAYVQTVFLSEPLLQLTLVFSYVRAAVSFLVLFAGSRFFLRLVFDPWRRSADLIVLGMGLLTAAALVGALGFQIAWTGPVAGFVFNGYFAVLSALALRRCVASTDARRRLIPFLLFSFVAYTALVVIGVVVYVNPPAPDAGIPINVTASGSFTMVWAIVVLVTASRWMALAPPADGTIAPAFVLDFGLSPREREVAQAIQTGETSKEIGERLFISQRTVETHLQSIYRKCGVTNRVELLNLINRYRTGPADPAP
jgi:DNA-binding CsgD family transcriptional regulator